MNFTDLTLLKRLGASVVSFTLALVFLLGGWILVSALNSEPDYDVRLAISPKLPQARPLASDTQPGQSSLSSQGEAYVDQMGRKPDSLPQEKLETKTEVFTLGCVRDGVKTQYKSTAKFVRIKGRLCPKEKTVLTSSNIVNRTNGFEATLFNLEKGDFSSDYISLAEGANQILLEIESDSGTRAVTELTVFRSKEF